MSNKSMVIQFVFINICKKKRNCLLICWKWMSIAKQIKPKCLNSYGFFNWLGFHRFDLPLQCTEFYCLYMSRGYEFLQISKEFRIPEVWKLSSLWIWAHILHWFVFGCHLFLSGAQSLNIVCHIQWRKGRICHYAFETSRLYLYGLVRNIGSLLMLANQTKKGF